MNSNEPLKEEVIREFPPLGKYRIFTRRGIRLGDRAQVDLLRDVLSELLRDLLM